MPLLIKEYPGPEHGAKARKAKTYAVHAEINARIAEIVALKEPRVAIETRQFAEAESSRHKLAEKEAILAYPAYIKAVKARHTPEEAGRYFHAALVEIHHANISMVAAIKRAASQELQAESSKRVAKQWVRVAEELQRRADVYDFEVEALREDHDDNLERSIEAARMLVLVSEANPEDPPYLSAAQRATHRDTIKMARESISRVESVGPVTSDVRQTKAYRLMVVANAGLGEQAKYSLRNLPYPSEEPGQVRSLDDLDEYLSGLARPKLEDLNPDDWNCNICGQPYTTDGAKAGILEGAILDVNQPEIPVTLHPCNHILGSTCLRQWLTPIKHVDCPLCRAEIP